MEAVNFREKLMEWDKVTARRAALRAPGRMLVGTHGCFGLRHE
jgi:hypothetical protein